VLGDLPRERFATTVEAAAYHLIADTLRANTETHLIASEPGRV
jgi:hypothetical protein